MRAPGGGEEAALPTRIPERGGGVPAASSPRSRAAVTIRRVDLRNVAQAFNNIAEELRRQYSLGYYPSRSAQAAERRQLKVRVKRPNLVVRARDSYVYKPSGTGGATTARQDYSTSAPAQPELRRRNFNGNAEHGATQER